MFLRSRRFRIYIHYGGFKEFEICRFLDFDRPVYRFQPVFSANRHDHRVSEVKAVQNIYTLGGFKEFEIYRFFDFDRPVYRFLPVFGPNRLDHRVSEVLLPVLNCLDYPESPKNANFSKNR